MVGYREIAAQLRAAITRGDFAPGESIPTEAELAEQYGVSRLTVRRALARLKTRGLVRTATRRGTYVAPRPVRLAVARYTVVVDPNRPRPDLGPWETACAEQGLEGRAEVVAVTRPLADDALAGRLGVNVGAELVCRARRMWVGEEIAQIQDAWIPAALADGTPLAGTANIIGGVLPVMTAAGLRPATATEEVSARFAEDDELERLGVGPGDDVVVLDVWRTTHDPDGRALEVVHIVADSRLSTLVYADQHIQPPER